MLENKPSAICRRSSLPNRPRGYLIPCLVLTIVSLLGSIASSANAQTVTYQQKTLPINGLDASNIHFAVDGTGDIFFTNLSGGAILEAIPSGGSYNMTTLYSYAPSSGYTLFTEAIASDTAGDITTATLLDAMRWLRLFGQVFGVSKWKDCSLSSRRWKCENRFYRFSRSVGRAGNSLIVFRAFHQTGISTACLVAC
jgi:hypothetical protein